MKSKIPSSSAPSQATVVDRDAVTRSTDVDQWLALMNQAIDESGWAKKQDALATFMGIDKSHLSRLRSGEKPWRVENVVALPDDIEARFEALRAESFGAVVLTRPQDVVEAKKSVLTGIASLLDLMSAPIDQLPNRANRMATASIAPVSKAVNE